MGFGLGAGVFGFVVISGSFCFGFVLFHLASEVFAFLDMSLRPDRTLIVKSILPSETTILGDSQNLNLMKRPGNPSQRGTLEPCSQPTR